jgi:hypothetical protein
VKLLHNFAGFLDEKVEYFKGKRQLSLADKENLACAKPSGAGGSLWLHLCHPKHLLSVLVKNRVIALIHQRWGR